MKELKLTDRIVLEFISPEGKEMSPFGIARELKSIAYKIEFLAHRGGQDRIDNDIEMLWEHECPSNGGFKILTDESLIHDFYYSNDGAKFVKKEEQL